MLIGISIIALAVGIFLGLYFLSRSIKNVSKSLDKEFEYIIQGYSDYEPDESDLEDKDDFYGYDSLFSEGSYKNVVNYQKIDFPEIDEDTMFFVFNDFDNIVTFFKLANLSIDNSIIGRKDGNFYLDLSVVSFGEDEKYRALVTECFGYEIRDNEIVNSLKDWLHTR